MSGRRRLTMDELIRLMVRRMVRDCLLRLEVHLHLLESRGRVGGWPGPTEALDPDLPKPEGQPLGGMRLRKGPWRPWTAACGIKDMESWPGWESGEVREDWFDER
jgi:hypothetical protein